jgi:hypothetical protein
MKYMEDFMHLSVDTILIECIKFHIIFVKVEIHY